MTEKMMNTATVNSQSADTSATPMLMMLSGNTTYLLGMHYKEDAKDTIEDKVKKLIRKDINEGNF